MIVFFNMCKKFSHEFNLEIALKVVVWLYYSKIKVLIFDLLFI